MENEWQADGDAQRVNVPDAAKYRVTPHAAGPAASAKASWFARIRLALKSSYVLHLEQEIELLRQDNRELRNTLLESRGLAVPGRPSAELPKPPRPGWRQRAHELEASQTDAWLKSWGAHVDAQR